MEWIQSNDEFFTKAREEKPTVFLFTAGWCPDCRFLDPFIDEVVAEYGDRFNFYKVNRDEFGDLCETLDIMGIPSFVVYKGGQVINRFVNGKRKTRQEIEAFLDDTLAKQGV
jgi:thioredoxin-like negative regulator of GroEL